jgi:hypothetical protein
MYEWGWHRFALLIFHLTFQLQQAFLLAWQAYHSSAATFLKPGGG